MAPLAGRPPFATDEPDTFYQTSPQPRPRVQNQQSQANRTTSAYDVYDNYLTPGEGGGNRNSGVDALGMGFMNASMDDDSDDEDDAAMQRARNAPVASSPSKHAALAAATGAKGSPSKGPYAPERLETPPPQYNPQQQRGSPQAARSPPPRTPGSPAIAAPRPGYATSPVAALNQSVNGIARPAPSAAPGREPGNGLRINPPQPGSPGLSPFGTPSPSGSPHPLQAPLSPITPVFARPQRTQTMSSANSIAFSESKGLIMRGEGEETLIPRGRGEKGDQFWRRFSMVAKDPEEKHPSSWLKKTQSGTSQLRSWVWIIGFVLLVCAAGGIGLGVYLSEQATAHYRPDAIGGSANDGSDLSGSSTTAGATKSAGKGAIATSSALHVSPTNTVARRDEPEAFAHATVGAGHAARNRHTAHFGAEFL
ncbi:hypothetical protein DFH06DRAFT_1339704 [Mycena polygramma]|nr:hypothetical protein DFH06DRAFT_1339704 [Mycena polygramma]